jgi:homocysteine S-methyltransferase
MIRRRGAPPPPEGALFITDGGLETTLVHHDQVGLPCFAAFVLLDDPAGRERLSRYYARYARLAHEMKVGMVLASPTWRANADWGARLGHDAGALVSLNRAAIDLMLELRDRFETPVTPMPVCGTIGPRGDGYRVTRPMSIEQARVYHAPQVHTFSASQADLVSAFTLNYAEEAMGIVLAARSCGMPVVISFTLETDGRLPSGETLAAAISRTDERTGGYAAYYMIDCAHPVHVLRALDAPGHWQRRVRGLCANASRRCHAELDASRELDAGDTASFGLQHVELKLRLPWLCVLGGCCGTDHRHVDAICRFALHVSPWRGETAPEVVTALSRPSGA